MKSFHYKLALTLVVCHIFKVFFIFVYAMSTKWVSAPQHLCYALLSWKAHQPLTKTEPEVSIKDFWASKYFVSLVKNFLCANVTLNYFYNLFLDFSELKLPKIYFLNDIKLWIFRALIKIKLRHFLDLPQNYFFLWISRGDKDLTSECVDSCSLTFLRINFEQALFATDSWLAVMTTQRYPKLLLLTLSIRRVIRNISLKMEN